MIVVDSAVWIANIRELDRAAVYQLREVVDATQILIGDLILLEVLRGARNARHASELSGYFNKFAIRSMLDAELARKAAANYRDLRRRGVTIRKTVDLIIGTFCIENDHELLQDDRDFLPMAEHLGLRLV